MATTDPIADMLTRIRNAQTAKHATVSIPLSRLKLDIAKILESEGYVENLEIDESGHGAIRLSLKYLEGREPVIMKLHRESRPGRRVYVKHDEIPDVLGGMGLSILSTSKGVMTGTAARQAHVGGEVLCSVY